MVGVSMCGKENARDVAMTVPACDHECCISVRSHHIDRVHIGAFVEKVLDNRNIPISRRTMQSRI
jgi:hypothetical protein